MTRTPPQPESIIWQHMVPPSPHNGGWAVIMHCKRMLHYGPEMWLFGPAGIERVYDRMVVGIATHGEPPLDFKRAWLLDTGALWWWAVHDRPWCRRAAATLEATRELWRATFGGNESQTTGADVPAIGITRLLEGPAA